MQPFSSFKLSSILTYTVKKNFSIFLSPTGMSLTKVSLGGNNDVIYKLFPPREILVSDIPAGVGNIEKLFYGVHYFTCMIAKTAKTWYIRERTAK